MSRRWVKQLWGVLFTGSVKDDEPMLLGAAWHAAARLSPPRYYDEPTRALLFCTRHAARAWCAQQITMWRADRDETDPLTRWRVRPVRVTETVKRIDP